MVEEQRVAERVARNNLIFREANESIRAAAGEHGLDGRVPFICECAEERCTEILRIDLAEYQRIRSSPIRFVSAPGHDSAHRYADVVERNDGYDVVEKRGEAAAVVAQEGEREN